MTRRSRTAPRTSPRDSRRPGVRTPAAALVALALAVTATVGTLPASAGSPVERVVVTGPGAAAGVLAAGGRVLAPLPLVGGVGAVLPHGARLRADLVVVPDRSLSVQAAGSTSATGVGSTVRATLGVGAPSGEGRGVTVAVVDTGVADLPDLAGRLEHVSVVGESGDGLGHGTFIAGLIASSGASTRGATAGVAPAARILDVKVGHQDGSTSLLEVLKGLQAVHARGDVDVVNLSLSSDSPLPTSVDPLSVALDRLWEDGITVVVPSGNDPDTVSTPGDDPLLLTVGGLAENGTADHADDTVAPWSGRGGDKPDLVAPGTSLLSLVAPGSDAAAAAARRSDLPAGHGLGSGTSFATAVTSGAAAALLGRRPALVPAQVKDLLTDSAYRGRELKRGSGGRGPGPRRGPGRQDPQGQGREGGQGRLARPRRPPGRVGGVRGRRPGRRRRRRRPHLGGHVAPGPHVGSPDLGRPHPAGPDLGGPHLGRPHLGGNGRRHRRLDGPDVGRPHLGRAHLGQRRLERPHVERAHLERRRLVGPHLVGVGLVGPHLVGPHLVGAYLVGHHLAVVRIPPGPSRAADVLQVSTPGATSAARRRARLLPRSPLGRLLLAATVLSLLVQGVARYVVAADGPVVDLTGALPWASGGVLLAGLLALTVLGDLVSVPLRHGEQVERLTFFEAALLLDVALLPAGRALTVSVAAMLLREVVRRRPVQKSLFNVTMLATASGFLVLVVHAITDPDAGLGPRTVVALVGGTLVFAAVNLLHMSRLLGVVAEADPWETVRDEARLSTVMALGNVALGGTVLAVASSAPAMLPFTVMPAAALLVAYRAAAQEAEERERSTRLLELSQLLAGRSGGDDLLAGFLELARQVFGADVAAAVLDAGAQPGGTEPLTVLDDRLGGSTRRPASTRERRLLERVTLDGAGTFTTDLPDGWERALVAPLEAEGRRLGAVMLAVRDRSHALGARELTLLTPTASALAVALRAAAHLRRVEEETGKLQAVVDQSSDGILVLDGDGVVQLWSPAVARLSGRSSAAAVGRRLPDLVVTRDAQDVRCDPFLVGRALLTPEEPQATVEVTLLRDDGEERVVRSSFAGAYDDDAQLQRVVVILHDVTRERQVERLKADFIATVSHELRTPVTPIKGYADLLLRKGDRMTPEKRIECLEVIVDRAGHLARLVEDLLLASRISATEGASAAQVEMGQDDLAALTARACKDFGAEGDRVTVRLPDAPLLVACDPVRVIQVLTNLVGNALKYSTPGSPVDVCLRVVDGVARVEVSDSGRGIPADQLERVFDKFHRVEDPMRMTTGGTGLGLYIARQLASAMGGTLACSSTLNVGSVFTFELRLALGSPLAGRPQAPATVAAAPVPTGAVPSGPAVAAPRPGAGPPTTGPAPGPRAAGPATPVAPAARGRHAPPWAVPPPRPAAAGGQENAQPLG